MGKKIPLPWGSQLSRPFSQVVIHLTSKHGASQEGSCFIVCEGSSARRQSRVDIPDQLAALKVSKQHFELSPEANRSPFWLFQHSCDIYDTNIIVTQLCTNICGGCSWSPSGRAPVWQTGRPIFSPWHLPVVLRWKVMWEENLGRTPIWVEKTDLDGSMIWLSRSSSLCSYDLMLHTIPLVRMVRMVFCREQDIGQVPAWKRTYNLRFSQWKQHREGSGLQARVNEKKVRSFRPFESDLEEDGSLLSSGAFLQVAPKYWLRIPKGKQFTELARLFIQIIWPDATRSIHSTICVLLEPESKTYFNHFSSMLFPNFCQASQW